VTVAVFSRSVASARSAGLITAAEEVLGFLVVVVVGCFRVLGCYSGVAVRGGAGEGFLLAGFWGEYCGSGERGGGGECGCGCQVRCRGR